MTEDRIMTITSCHDVERRLSEHADGTLTPEERDAVHQHFATCAACAGVAADLERVRSAARSLGPMPPPDHVWMEIAGQLRRGRTPPEPRSLAAPALRQPVWQWIGLAAMLVLVTGATYLLTHPRTPAPTTAAAGADNAPANGSVQSVADELKQAEAHYDKAIDQLQQLATGSDSPLAPNVTVTLQKNLQVIDHAIADSRTALEEHPESELARESLFDALRHKLSVLQNTVALMNDMRKGDQAGAARIVGGGSSS